jgi:hypothetical protein
VPHDHSLRGGADFVRYYFAELNRAYRTADASALAALSDTGCTFCANNVTNVRELREKRQRYAADPLAISGVSPFAGAPTGQQYYQEVVRQVGATVIGPDGVPVRADARRSGYINVVLQWSSGHWLVIGAEHA